MPGKGLGWGAARGALLLSAATCAMAASSTARAQPASPAQATSQVGDVVITARKRAENLQRVPLSVTASTGEQLRQQQITQPSDLMRIVPSLQSAWAAATDNAAQFGLRGQLAADVLLGFSQPVGLYEDSVNIPHPFGANNAFVDLARVEVLNGPQGTLYGRNTTGGAINIITRDADYRGYHGFVEGEVGDYGDWKAAGALNATLIPDALAVRVAFQHWNRQGFGRSLITGQRMGDEHDDTTVRLSIRADPLSNVRANLKMEYTSADHTSLMSANVSLPPPTLATASNFQAMTPAQRIGFVAGAPTSTYLATAIWAGGPATAAAYAGAVGTGAFATINSLIAQGQTLLAPCIGQDPLTNCSSINTYDNVTTWHGAIDVSWDITPDITLRSITGAHGLGHVPINGIPKSGGR